MVETSTCVEGRVFTHNVGWVPKHLKHPLKTVDQYWSLVSDHGQMARVCGDIIAPYIPKLCGNNDVLFIFFSLILMFQLSLSDGMVDGPIQMGPTNMVEGHRAYHPGVLLFLNLEHTRQSSGRLRRRFQINYPRSSSITVCIAAWNQLPRDGGGVMSTHVRTASG